MKLNVKFKVFVAGKLKCKFKEFNPFLCNIFTDFPRQLGGVGELGYDRKERVGPLAKMTRKSKEMTPKDSRPTNCALLCILLTWLVFSFCFSVTRVGAASSVEKSVLEIHNKYRAMAGLQLLQWDTALQQTASERAKQLGEASKCLTLSPEIDWQTIDVLPLASPKLLRSDWLESDDEKSRRHLSISHALV